MKLLFLHISDMHIKNDSAIKKFQISKIADSLNSFSWDRMTIFISGDIAYSGEKKQYDVAKKIIGVLISSIKKQCNHSKWIDTVCIPGNHDVYHNGHSRSSIELQKINNEATYSEHLEEELKKQSNFFSFASNHKCFCNNKIWDRKMLSYNDYKIEINLINSAIFSILEEDKGLHFIPDQCISEIVEPSNADFVITISHHSPEWYNDNQKNKLDRTICSKSSIIMYGHEHYIVNKTISYKDEKEAFIQNGGCLCENENWSKSAFHVGVLDTETNKYEHREFIWNEIQKQYENNHPDCVELSFKPSKERMFDFTSDFDSFLHEDEKRELTNDFLEYYVFPRLESEEIQNGDVIECTSEESFLNEITKKRRIIISGGHNSGKTVLLKKLAIDMKNNFAIIFCRLNDIKSKKEDKLIKYRFQEIYGESKSDYNRFLQLPKDKKVLIIDDVDQIEKNALERFIHDKGDSFGYIILATKQVIDLDLFERTKVQLKTNDTIYTYKISPLYADKRLKVIEKIVKLKVNDQSSVDKIVTILSEAITSQRRFINLDPDFVIRYVEYYCNNVGDASVGDNNVFSKVFEANLTKAISDYQSSSLIVDKVFILLSKVGYYIHFNKAYPISAEQVSEIVRSYNKEYGSNVDYYDFIRTVLNAKILIVDEQSNGYRFISNNYLAYFVAKELNRRYNETGDDTDLKMVLHSACFGINADILMFVSYITDNIRVLNLILAIAKNYVSSWNEFDFKHNCPELFKLKRNHKVNLPSSNIVEAEKKRQIEVERQNNNKLETIDIYDYSDDKADSVANRIIRSLQLLIVISRCLPNFEHIMKKPDKEAFVLEIYSMPNKIFSAWANLVDKEIDEIVSFFKDQSKDYYSRQKQISENDIIKALQWSGMSFLLDLYNLSIYCATKDHTIRYLNNFDYHSKDTYMIEHLMMLERQSSSKVFSDEAIKMNLDKKEHLYKTMLTRVVSHALIFKKDLKFSQSQQLKSAFFPGVNNQKNILVQRIRNKDKEE